MKLIRIPVEGDIELVEREDRVMHEDFTLFGPERIIEQVRFGMPTEPGRPPVQYTGTVESSVVVMLIDENGIAYGLPVNPRASVLYQAGRHNARIYGEAYLCMCVRDPYEGDTWGGIEPPYDRPGYWVRVCGATEFRS